MAKKKACKSCRYFFEGDECPVCKGKLAATSYQGRLFIVDPKKSVVAGKINVETKGEYAIKVR